MYKIYDKLFWQGPMGLGDYFVGAGAINHYADRCNELHVPVTEEKYETIACLFSEHPNIKVVKFELNSMLHFSEEIYCKKHGLGKIMRMFVTYARDSNPEKPNTVTPILIHQYYGFLELPIHLRYSNFRLPKNIPDVDLVYNTLNPNNEKYVLIHAVWSDLSQKSRVVDPELIKSARKKLGLPDYKIIDISIPQHSNMLSYMKLIENAEEIHCVPTGFFWLVEGLTATLKAKLFYHDLRAAALENPAHNMFHNKWKLLLYKDKF